MNGMFYIFFTAAQLNVIIKRIHIGDALGVLKVTAVFLKLHVIYNIFLPVLCIEFKNALLSNLVIYDSA
jgi:hypothetical protein